MTDSLSSTSDSLELVIRKGDTIEYLSPRGNAAGTRVVSHIRDDVVIFEDDPDNPHAPVGANVSLFIGRWPTYRVRGR